MTGTITTLILCEALGQAVPEIDLAEAIRRRLAPLGGVDLEPHPPVATKPASLESS